jgi:hypothetical protein
VQLYYSGENCFVADQIFVKYDVLGDVDDILVIENKLLSTTPLTNPQSVALKSKNYRVRSRNESSQFGSGKNLIQGMELNFSKNIQWYKVYDGTDGKTIQNIINIK